MTEYTPITNLRGPAARITAVSAETVPASSSAEVEMTGPDQNRHFAFKVPRGLPGVNAVPTDDAVAVMVAAKDSATSGALRPVIAAGSGMFSAQPYLKGDGVFDDSDGLIAAAAAAHAAGLTLFIPAVPCRISKPISLFGSVRSEAQFVADASSNARIVIARSGAPVSVVPSGVSGLIKGASQIAGVPGPGTAVIVSSEELIKRYMSGPATPYTKQEAVRIGTDRSVFPPLDNTYNTSLITEFSLYPPEEPTVVAGISVTLDGTVAGVNDNFVTVQRSNVEVVGLRVVNSTGLSMTSAVRVQDAVSVRIISPRIHGFDLSGAGYGIAKYRSSDISIEDAEITQCRHAITGRYENRVRLSRGFYGGGIDTHWGTGIVAEAITATVPEGGTVFAVAGGTLEVIGGDFFGGRNLVGIRIDTPEMTGIIDLRGSWKWTCDASTTSAPTPWVVGYSTLNDGGAGYFFGHVLAAPTVRVRGDGMVTLPTGRLLSVVAVGAQSFQRSHFPTVEVDNVKIMNAGTRVVAASLVKSTTTVPDTGSATQVVVRRMVFPAGNDGGIYITNEPDTAGGALFTVLVEDSSNVAIKVPEPSVSSLVVRRSTIIQVMRVAATSLAFAGVWSLEDCDFVAPIFSGYWLADFLRCRWSGAVTNTQAPVNSRCRSYMSGRTMVGATGVPTVSDPYRNPAYYA